MLIFLLGYMGSGKTSTGEKLSKKLGYAFIDLDEMVEKKNNKSISAIFEEDGEDFFRESEKNCLEETFSLTDTVISTGGGTPCFFDNMDQMKKNGLTVYLKLAAGSLFHRLAPGKHKRPLIANMPDLPLMEFIVKELDKREVYYKQADLNVRGENLKIEELIELVNKRITN
jgi:shikimate kinase